MRRILVRRADETKMSYGYQRRVSIEVAVF